MKQNQTQIWIQAVEIYATLSDHSVEIALKKLNNIKNLDIDLKQAVLTLISSGNQASMYIENNLTPNFDIKLPTAPDYKINTIISEYQLLEKLGHGGMSQVFKAKRIDTDAQKLVAIKIFSPNSQSELLLEQFINEQKILSELSHPHIVDMLHGGTTPNNIAYLVMELIEDGLPINEYFKQNKSSNQDKIKFVNDCSKALSYSHANLVIHRDLKPENILVNKDQVVKIVDFGIAKLINKDLIGNKTTLLALTPSYAAPEQINSENISVKTDIFSLAVVALELLYGKQFLPKDRLIKSCINDELAIEKCLKSVNIDSDLRNILQQALQQKPHKRYASMQSFADDLNNYLEQKPVNATKQSFIYRLKKFANRRSALFATLVTLISSILIGFMITLWQYNQIKIEAGKALQVKQFMLDSYNITDPNVSQGVDITAVDLLHVSSLKLEENTNIDPEIKFELLQTIGLAYGQLGFYLKAVEFLEHSLEINPRNTKSLAFLAQYLQSSTQQHKLDEILQEINEESFESATDRLKIYRIRAKELFGKGKLQQALNLINETNRGHKNIVDEIDNNRLIAEINYHLSKPDKAIDLLVKTLNNSDLKSTNTSVLGIKKDLVQYYTKTGKFDLALNESTNLIKQLRLILGNRHPDLGDSLIQNSNIHSAKGDLQSALLSAQESHDIFVQLFGQNHVKVAETLTALGILSYRNRQIEQAEKQLAKSLEIFDSIYPPEHIETLQAKTNFAAFLNAIKQTEKAARILEEVHAIQLKSLGEKNRSTLSTQQHLSRALATLGRYEEAIEMAKNTVEIAYENFDHQDPTTLGSDYVLGKIYLQAKQYSEALEIMLKQELDNHLKQNNPKHAILLLDIAQNYEGLEQQEKAISYYNKSLQSYQNIYSKNHIMTLKTQLLFAKYLKSIDRKEEMHQIVLDVQTIITNEKIANQHLNDNINNLMETEAKTN